MPGVASDAPARRVLQAGDMWNTFSSWGAPEIARTFALSRDDDESAAELSAEEVILKIAGASTLEQVEALHVDEHQHFYLRFGDVVLPNLVTVDLSMRSTGWGTWRDLRNAKWPKLKSFALAVVDPESDVSADDFRSTLEWENIANIEHLGLGAPSPAVGDAIAALVPKANLTRRLTSLDLSIGLMSNKGAAHLLDGAGALRHLKKLVINKNKLSAAVQTKLERTFGEALQLVPGAREDENVAVGDLAGIEPIARDEELERAIEAAPEDAAKHRAYAEWLSGRGCPRGELIARVMPDASPAFRVGAAKLLRERRRYFMGGLGRKEDIYLAWWFGWIESARIDKKNAKFVTNALTTLMSVHSSRFIKRLALGPLGNKSDYSVLYPILVAGGRRPTMRALLLGTFTFDDEDLSKQNAGDISFLNELYPNLEDLRIRAKIAVAGDLDYPNLKTLVLQSTGASKETVEAIAARRYPELEHLEIWLGPKRRGLIDALQPILEGKHLPSLKRLVLKNCEVADELMRALLDAPIVRQLRELDLSGGQLSDDAAKPILEDPERFAHLARLDVSRNCLSQATTAAIRALDVAVRA